MIGSGSFSSLLLNAASLSPVELRLALPRNLQVSCMDVTLPSFHRATSMDLRARDLHLTVFAKPHAVNTTGLIDMSNITVHSASLEELVVEHGNRWTRRTHVSVDSPVLKQLTASFHACGNIGVSILAPMVDKVCWRCSYAKPICGLGLWGLSEVQLPSVHVLSLHLSPVQDSVIFPNAELSFGAEIDKHMVTNFSGLDLHLSTKGHVFGAFVLHLLGMHRIRTALRNLKIVLLRSEVKDACPVNCFCDEPKNWRTETITLADLENMEIEGLGGEDHEFDFLEVIFRCAPMLKTVTVRLSDGVTPSVDWCTKVNNIFMAYPSVECNADLVSRAKAVC
ncbi:uncharacterized protein LOC119368375 isoform X2 [Triticum dicoccoides]|uniref:uncharacterized protein LOC119368375 isoform X2 n=1 Tax=Triticum dicoccoides TaxID=85692 RepID=UPI00188F606E|nr:uncharacterized protein LOC119368375 isoform X2 [Triticum dicoccoides]